MLYVRRRKRKERGFLHDDLSANQLLHQNEIVHLVVHNDFEQLDHVRRVQVLQNVRLGAQRLYLSENNNRDVDGVIAPKPVQLAVGLHRLHVLVDGLERVVLVVLLREARVDLPITSPLLTHSAVHTRVDLLQQRVLVDVQAVVAVADFQLIVTSPLRSHIHRERDRESARCSFVDGAKVGKRVRGIVLQTAVDPHHLLPVARAERTAQVLEGMTNRKPHHLVVLVLIDDRPHHHAVQPQSGDLFVGERNGRYIVAAHAVILVSVLVEDIRLANNRSRVPAGDTVQGTQHFLEGVGIATNVALDQFDGSFNDEVQIAGQLALGEENGVLWIGDLLQVVDDVLSLFFREYRSKQVRLL